MLTRGGKSNWFGAVLTIFTLGLTVDTAAQAPPEAGSAPAEAAPATPTQPAPERAPDSDPAAAEAPVTPMPTGDCPPNAFCDHAEVAPPEGAPVSAPTAEDDAASALPPDDDEGRTPAPSGPLPSESGNWSAGPPASQSNPLTTAGLVIFGVGYLPALLVGLIGVAIEDEDEDGNKNGEVLLPLLLPVAGPPITGALTDASGAVWTVLLIDTAVQAVGLVLFGAGLAMEGNSPTSARPMVLPHVAGDGKHSLSFGVSGIF